MATLNPPILASDIDAKSPVDETLMGAIKSNLERVDDAITAAVSSNPVSFRVNGPLSGIPSGRAKRIDTAHFGLNQTLSYCKLFLDKPGTEGTLECDLRKLYRTESPIKSIDYQFTGSTQAIAMSVTASTRSVTRATPTVSTQSISYWKAALNIQSVVQQVTTGYWQINLDQAPDANYEADDYILIAGTTNWNGTYQIVRVNDYGSRSLTVYRASGGVAQTSAAGTIQLRAYSFNYVNPVSTEFAAGELVTMTGHTNAVSNGFFYIHAINSGGNNIVTKKATDSAKISGGVTQAGIAGTAVCHRMKYNLAAPASTAEFIPGEYMQAISHTYAELNMSYSAASATLKVVAVNDGGNNVKAYTSRTDNAAGPREQATVAGTIGACHWVYSLSTSPAGKVSVGDTVIMTGHTLSGSDGTYTVREVSRGGLNNIVVYSWTTYTQAGVAGAVKTLNKVVSFQTDQSSLYQVGDHVEIEGATSAYNNLGLTSNLGHLIKQINYGGGANYNIVIEFDTTSTQTVPFGWVALTSRSVFSTRPKVSVIPSVSSALKGALGQGNVRQETTSAVFNSNAQIETGSIIGLYVLSVPTGADTFSLLVR